MLDWKPVLSSNLTRILYFKKRKLLVVQFKGERIWLYVGVPLSVVKALLAAESKGRYFNNHIRTNPRYPHQEVTDRFYKMLLLAA